MMMKPKVTELSTFDESELIEISSKAFFATPQIQALMDNPEHTKTIVKNLIDLYRRSGTIRMFGIKKDGKLVCISLCIDSNSKPSFTKLIKFGFSVVKTLGIKGFKHFWICNKNKPKYDKICLEVMLYGTLPSHQKKGLGRHMLNFLYDFAKKNKYGGVTGVTNSSRPAFKLYMNDGWIVDKAFNFGNYQFCWIRRIV